MTHDVWHFDPAELRVEAVILRHPSTDQEANLGGRRLTVSWIRTS